MQHDINHKGKARIFKSPFLEAMTKTTPLISILVYGPAIAGLLFVALNVVGLSVGTTITWFLAAFIFWTFAEYFLHRYLFHWYTEAEWTQRFHFIMHGNHHEYPNDEERLLMPPVPGLILASVLFGLFYLIFLLFGRPELTWAFFPGFFLGYLMYSFVHYAIHQIKPPKYLKRVWIHHSQHHYQHQNKAFGVSSYFWDIIFGTMPPKNKKH